MFRYYLKILSHHHLSYCRTQFYDIARVIYLTKSIFKEVIALLNFKRVGLKAIILKLL